MSTERIRLDMPTGSSREDRGIGSPPPQATETTPLVSQRSTLVVPQDTQGLSVTQTALLVVGEIAGGGVLALPRALVKTGWLGVPILILIGVMAAFSGKRLGDCWSFLEETEEQTRTKKRNPYVIIAEQTLGKTWSAAISVAIIVTQFGVAVVYLLLAAQIIQQVFFSLVPTMTLCLWYLVVTLAMTPLLLFGTPKDFSFLGTIAFFSMVIACIIYFIQMMNDVRPFVFRWGIHGFRNFSLAIGIMMFSFNGASSFPTIQREMANMSKFNKSLQYSFAAILAIYLPISIAGYAVYGESVGPNFVTSLTATPLTLAGDVLMAVQLVTAFIITVNPVCHEMEEMYNITGDSLGRRILVRVSIVAGIMFIGESIPRFYTVMALVGATSIACLTFILPCYCFLKLDNRPRGESRSQCESSGWIRMICWQVIVLGVVGAVAATYASISAIFSNSQATPCYLR